MQAAKNNETIQNLDMLLVITTFETPQTNQEAILGYLDFRYIAGLVFY